MRPAPATSFPRSHVPLTTVIAGLVLLVLLGLGTAGVAITSTTSTAGASAVSLVNDHGGAALFSAGQLSPGQVEAACVGLTAGGSVDPATEVSLYADVLPGGLSPYLQVWVERGSVPAGGTCGNFTGVQVWSGTLNRFPPTGGSGIPTGWHPALSEQSVYRFTVSVLDDPRAQNLQTSATFRWSFTEAAPPPPPPPPPAPPTPVPSPGPLPVPTDVPTAAPTTDAAPVTSTAASTAPAAATVVPPTVGPPASSPVPTAGGRPGPVIQAPPIATGPAAAVTAAIAAVGHVAQQVGRTAVAVARNGQFPLGLAGVMAGFLFLQGRLDRRDPKLALARVREELSEYRAFPEPPLTEST